ncbi:Helix-turn-helix domain-containing protein [Bryocella elongata]|uniref:Helix-turn-helix domain-containing protein n=1 Tax=Bryocella elongata TaxID=863522 RepID=A0A1H6A447_9BACT|nr:AraC family transcriptional regulator [Bryocella elongata]SEG43513.1 Helix-turn-helix domain-containing protein [Bryocella elongata]
MDQLSPFFARFALSARVFYSGQLCGISSDHESERAGHLHVLRSGTLRIVRPGKPMQVICEPSVLFYPRPMRHQFQASEEDGPELVCAQIEFGAGLLNPLVSSLPELLLVPLASMRELAPTVELLFAEAFGERSGRQAAVDRLAEYFLVLLLRSALDHQQVQAGVLSGLADPRLSKAITAMHERPEHAWTLVELARLAGMSRPQFAARFHEVVGATPFDYLTDWRIGAAQALLRKGEPLKMVAPAVGYAGSTALSRVFSKRMGVAPMEWLARNPV